METATIVGILAFISYVIGAVALLLLICALIKYLRK